VPRLAALGLAALTVATPPVATSQPGAGFPPLFEKYLTADVKLTADERSRLLAGAPVTKLLPADSSKEVALFGAIWVNAPIGRYVEAAKDIENFERGGGFVITRRISTPPRLDDFARLRIPDDDLQDLRSCRVGSCELKLGEEGLQRLRQKVDWNSPTARAMVETVMQTLALEYVTGYLEGGNTRLAVYRDSSRPRFTADEFRSMIDQMPELTTYMPELRRYLLEYPKVTIPGATSLLYWQETEFGLKPTIRINHLTIRESPTEAVIASKMLYASHYFWTALELRVLLPDPSRGPGFWFISVTRSRSDGLAGFTGMIVRGRARSEAENGTRMLLEWTKKSFER
jgi:hypothetical protein